MVALSWAKRSVDEHRVLPHHMPLPCVEQPVYRNTGNTVNGAKAGRRGWFGMASTLLWRPRRVRWPGLKGYVTNLTGASADTVIGAYHQLSHIEKSFRMSKHDLQARPIYHHQRESIDAHLTIVFARAGRLPLDRAANRLEHQKIRAHRTPLPHHPDQGRQVHNHRARPHPRGSAPGPSPQSSARQQMRTKLA